MSLTVSDPGFNSQVPKEPFKGYINSRFHSQSGRGRYVFLKKWFDFIEVSAGSNFVSLFWKILENCFVVCSVWVSREDMISLLFIFSIICESQPVCSTVNENKTHVFITFYNSIMVPRIVSLKVFFY